MFIYKKNALVQLIAGGRGQGLSGNFRYACKFDVVPNAVFMSLKSMENPRNIYCKIHKDFVKKIE